MNIENIKLLPTEQVQGILHEELRKERKNDKKILMLLEVLEEREIGGCVPDHGEAWRLFVKRYHTKMAPGDTHRQCNWRRWWGIMAASVAIFLVVSFGIPKVSGYDNIFELIASWADDFLVLSNSSNEDAQSEYVFKTDNSGLQKVYDAVTEMGVIDPVVPTWLPEGYELVELEDSFMNGYTKVCARFACGKAEILLSYQVYHQHHPSQLPKDEKTAEKYEHNGMVYSFFSNEDNCTAVSNTGNFIYLLSIDESKEILLKVINSI